MDRACDSGIFFLTDRCVSSWVIFATAFQMERGRACVESGLVRKSHGDEKTLTQPCLTGLAIDSLLKQQTDQMNPMGIQQFSSRVNKLTAGPKTKDRAWVAFSKPNEGTRNRGGGPEQAQMHGPRSN